MVSATKSSESIVVCRYLLRRHSSQLLKINKVALAEDNFIPNSKPLVTLVRDNLISLHRFYLHYVKLS